MTRPKPRLDQKVVDSLEDLMKDLTPPNLENMARYQPAAQYIKDLIEHYRDPDSAATREKNVKRTTLYKKTKKELRDGNHQS